MNTHERFRAVLAYDGTAYQGFQRLPSGTPTVQGAIEAALSKIAGETVTITGAGRTDAGVHATGQVIAFNMFWRHREADLLRAINATLPNDIALQRLERAAPEFHPRYDALSRTYEYTVYEAATRQPLLVRTAWWVYGELDMRVMNEAAKMLIGIHDFASFGTPPLTDHGSKSTIRQMFCSEWAERETQFSGRMLVYTIEANAFLYHMVRTITGTLVEIGSGRMTLDAFEKAFMAKDRARIGKMSPPHGLSLTRVRYNNSAGQDTPPEIP